jgi:hypothetical protein
MSDKNEIEKVYKFKNHEDWKREQQLEPNSSWVKERKLGGSRKSLYVPLPIQQALADMFFREFDVFEEKYTLVVNEILCTVRISVLPDYPNSEHRIISGTAAKPIQQDSLSSASSFPNGKKTNAMEYNSPASRGAAISNALTTFANIFGRNLGRDVKNNFSFIKPKKEEKENGK